MASIINADNGVASGSVGLKQSADTTGNLVLQTNGNTVVTFDTSLNSNYVGAINTTTTVSATGNITGGNILTGGSVSITGNITTPANAVVTGSVSSVNTFGYKNRFINGGMTVSQRATGATVVNGTAVPTASAGYYTADRWFMYSTGANVTANTVSGSGNVLNNTQITGAASVTAVGVGQRIEQRNSIDLANSVCTLSVQMSNSLLTTVTWTASYANTADTFGTVGTPTKTQIATGTFTVTSTLTTYSTQISIPAAATTGIEILFTVGAQTSGTWVIGSAQFEKGAVATPFDYRDYGRELILCQRYYQKSYEYATVPGTTVNNENAIQQDWGSAAGGIASSVFPLAVTMRTSPTLTVYDVTGNSGKVTGLDAGSAQTQNVSYNNANATLVRVYVRMYAVSYYGISYMFTVAAEI